MSHCELSRGRWREAHQDQDEVPPELRCLADGSYPVVSPAPVMTSSPAEPVVAPAQPAPASLEPASADAI